MWNLSWCCWQKLARMSMYLSGSTRPPHMLWVFSMQSSLVLAQCGSSGRMQRSNSGSCRLPLSAVGTTLKGTPSSLAAPPASQL